jgi:hypothetical protein
LSACLFSPMHCSSYPLRFGDSNNMCWGAQN